MDNLPSGTVTFLFTDMEGSTRLWQEKPQAMAVSHSRHDEILREAIEAHRGFIFQTAGDSFSAAFHNASDALNAALAAQRSLQADAGEVRVRMGLHTGEAEILLDGDKPDYSGYTTVAAAQRVMSVAHGGQVLLSQTTHDLAQNDLPKDASLRDMGEHSLKDLRMPLHLYQLVAPGLPVDFPHIKSLNSTPNNLPLQLTSFVGREKEIAEIKSLLDSARLVTLTGSGGTGKTRLSQEVSAQMLENFPQGVWLIELAPLTEPAQIIPAMAQVFGLHELPFQQLAALVTDYVREKNSLLILDNCEHLIEACARLADELLHQCAGLKILASSREALGIAGEVAYRIPSLADTESTQLFVERAQAANPKFQLTDTNANSIAQICSRLDGIPLAIELAAARTRLLAPEQIASKLDDRFRLLVGGSRTALPRQQTLRALIDWSYGLLSDDEKRLLQFASVFVGGWTLEALEAVSDDPNTIEYLEGLVNKSLVVTEENESEMRYSMLETIRQYAREKLFDANLSPVARERHYIYFDKFSESLWNSFRSPMDQLFWRNKVDDELENLRAALAWGLENDIENVLNLAANLAVVSGWISSVREDIPAVEEAVKRVRALPPVEGEAHLHRKKLLAKTLFALGMINMGTKTASETLREAIAFSRSAGDRLILGYNLEMYYTSGRFGEAPGAMEGALEGLTIFTTEIDDVWGLAMAYQNMVSIAIQNGDLAQKEKYYTMLKDLLGEAPTSFQAGIFLLGIGLDENMRGNYATAKQIFENGLNIFKRIRNKGFQAIMSSELGHIARHTGDFAQAKKIYAETLRSWQDLGNRAAISHQLECSAFIAIYAEEPQRAARLLGAAEALRERIGSPMSEYERLEYEQNITQLRSMFTRDEFDALWVEGRSMTMEDAIQLALAHRL